MIEVSNLSKRFGPVEAVKDISFRVEKGKIWGFLGPNGAGKTTTMRILTGYLPPSEGCARIGDIDVTIDPKAVKRMVGYLPENVPVYPELTVREYLFFVAELFDVERKKIPFAVERVVEKTNLQGVYTRLIRNISRGYRQRLGLAQAIIHEPQVLILDEPTIGLDPAQIVEIRQMIQSFRESATVILSSHILPEITQVCDGAVIIKNGALMAYMDRDEWGKNLEIVTATINNPALDDIATELPFVKEAVMGPYSIKLELLDTYSDINRLLRYLLDKDVKVREVKSGMESLYMKIISSEEGRNQ